MNIKELLNCDDFDPHFLLKIYNKHESAFDVEKFKIFIDNYIKKANKFEKKTGIPKKYFSEKINLSLFSKERYIGYSKVKDVYIYFNDNSDAIFLRDKKEIHKINKENQKNDCLINKLDEIFSCEDNNKNSEIANELYLSKNFKIKKINNFYIRYYLNTLYDIVIKFNNVYYFFLTIENIDEYSFSNHGGGLCDSSSQNYTMEKDLLKIKRMLKIGRIGISNLIEN